MALFVVAALVQFGILLLPPVRPFVDGFSGALAVSSARLIQIFGGTCLRSAAILSNPARGFALEVRDGCNGVNVTILLWAAILAYPSAWNRKLLGLAAGGIVVQTLNLLRLISLFYLGQYNQSWFEFAHLYLWETMIILDAVVFFAVWSRYEER
jgi:exosortase H (IPTLxxWG-CTERM-specific)